LLRGRFHRVLARHGCRTTDHFAGFQITGRFRTRGAGGLPLALPDGSTELMCHPGYCGERCARAHALERKPRAGT
jgi:chitin disaccharide deacetylase